MQHQCTINHKIVKLVYLLHTPAQSNRSPDLPVLRTSLEEMQLALGSKRFTEIKQSASWPNPRTVPINTRPRKLLGGRGKSCRGARHATRRLPISRVKGGFFLLHAAKVRSSCEEGPGQSALQSAYHNPQLDETELKQNRTTLSFRPKIANKQINKLADAVGGKSRWGQNWCKARIGRTDS